MRWMQMIKIAVCDDEEIFGKKLHAMVSQYLDEKKLFFEIDIFHSGIEFVELGPEMSKYQIVFLDINMDDLDGIETAKQLRHYCKDSYLVFVTAFLNYTLEGYKVEAIRYILKGATNFKDLVYEALDAICEKMRYVEQKEVFDFKEGKKEISINRIAYIESNLHKLKFYVLESDYVSYTLSSTLNAIEGRFEENRFVRIHQSFLVNLSFIVSIANYKAYLQNGLELPIAKNRFKEVREKYVKFRGEV